MVPFLAIYLDGMGFSSLEIGEVLAVVTATKVIGPTLWAMLSDKTGKQVSVMQLGTVLATISFFFLFFFDHYWPILLLFALFSLFWTATLPQLEVYTLHSIRRSPKIYARIRLWGSVGFTALAIASGEILEIYGAQSYVFIGFFIMLALTVSAYLLKERPTPSKKTVQQGSIINKLVELRFVIFFLAGMFLQISFGPYNGFFALYLRGLDYPGVAVGMFLAIGVAAEIAIFIVAGKLFKAFTIKALLIFSMVTSVFRWALVGSYGDVAWLLAFSQLLHAFGFGVYHSASMQFIQQHFNANQQNRGQAVYIGGVFGIGGAIGAYLTGALWAGGEGGTLAFYAAAIVAFVSSLLIVLLPKNGRAANVQS